MNPTAPDWNALRAQVEAEAAARLATDTAMAAAIPGVVAALREMLTHEPDNGDVFRRTLGDEIGECLRRHGCSDWADALRERLEPRHQVSDARLIAAELAIGRAAGEFCGGIRGSPSCG